MASILGRAIEKKPMYFIAIIITVTIILSSFISGLEFNTDFNDFTPEDPLVQASLRISEYFGSGQQIIIIRAEAVKNKSILDGQVIKDIDNLRTAYELLPMKEYAKFTSAPIYSGRGCFGKCEFCTVSKHWKSTYRARSVKNILKEIKEFGKYGFKKVNFKDESLTLDREHAIELFDALAEADLGIEYKGKTRLDDLDMVLLEKMKKANFKEIHFGVETLNEKTLQSIKKEITRDDIINKTKMARDMGFVINPSIILGSPGDTKESLRELADFVKEIYEPGKVKVYTCINTPHPGSTQRMKAEQRGLTILSNDLNKYTHFFLVSVPQSLGNTEEAIRTIAEIQNEIVTAVNGPEPLINAEEIIAQYQRENYQSGIEEIINMEKFESAAA